MAALKTLVSWLALLFQFLFSLTLAGLGAFALANGPEHLRLEMLPWHGVTLAFVLLGGGLFGLATVALAAVGRLRILFFLWSLAAAAVLTRGLVFSGYRFQPGQWKWAAYLVAAAWFAVIGGFLLMLAKPAPGPRKYRVR